MSIATSALTNLIPGELRPRLEGITNLAKYFNGCRILDNDVSALQEHPAGMPLGRHFASFRTLSGFPMACNGLKGPNSSDTLFIPIT